MEEADKMFEEVVQVEKIACFLGSWWGGSANRSNFIKGKCHMGKWHIIALFEQINTDHKKQQSKVLVAALSMLDVSSLSVDCERLIVIKQYEKNHCYRGFTSTEFKYSATCDFVCLSCFYRRKWKGIQGLQQFLWLAGCKISAELPYPPSSKSIASPWCWSQHHIG